MKASKMPQTGESSRPFKAASILIIMMIILPAHALNDDYYANEYDIDGWRCVYSDFWCNVLNLTSLTSDWVNSYSKPIEPVNGLPIAFGDINYDHMMDILLLTDNGHRLELLQGKQCVDGKSPLTYFGSRNCLSHNKDFECHFEHPVVNVVISDFTGSGLPDALVTLKKEEGKYDIRLVLGGFIDPWNPTVFRCNETQLLLENVTTQPFVLDYNGDMVSDFIVEKSDCKAYLWTGGMSESHGRHDDMIFEKNWEEIKILTSQFLAPERRQECLTNLTEQHLLAPHSSAFVNLNKHTEDLTPDIYFNGDKEVEYIFNVESMGFSRKENYPYPAKLRGQSLFIDLDYNGRLEHVIPVCGDAKAESFDACTTLQLMALNRPPKESEKEATWENILVMGNKFANRSLTFASHHWVMGIDLPATMRVADIDYDGYPDLVTVLKDRQSERTFAAVFLNKPVDEKDKKENKFKRFFELEWTSEDIPNIGKENVVLVTLFDIFNNGLLHLLITTESADKSLSTHPYDFYTYLKKTAYYSFLRITTISGRCSNKADLPGYLCQNSKSVAFGTAPPGVTVCFKGPFSGQQNCGGQLSQSAHMALQLPYLVFGLGDVINVVEGMKISIANGMRNVSKLDIEETIPGSNLIVVPFKPNTPETWEVRCFINMSIYSLICILFFLALCAFLAVTIYILHKLEDHEIKKENAGFREQWTGSPRAVKKSSIWSFFICDR